MLRPSFSPFHAGAREAAEPAGFAGLADMLEPDGDDDVTSMRLPTCGTRASPVDGVRRTSHRSHVVPPASVRGLEPPASLPDFAFADTVFASELPGDEPPPSGPILVNDADGHTQCLTPLAYPLPSPSKELDLPTRMRVALAHLQAATRRAHEEMRVLWAGTTEMVDGNGADPASAPSALRAPLFVRRLLALWSCFQWSRADLTRAAMIGLAVFITAATVGAATIGRENLAGSGPEVRGGRTLEQHTGTKNVTHAKR